MQATNLKQKEKDKEGIACAALLLQRGKRVLCLQNTCVLWVENSPGSTDVLLLPGLGGNSPLKNV